ncbi:MAG: hypothetical protein AAFO69_15475 [Bacteroidota bacterium]
MMQSNLLVLYRLITYNVKVIFANKFIYFLLAALGFFGFIITITVLENPSFDESVIFGFLLFPGILLIFYPMAYGIQNDNDSKMIETIFGIPNYRYKVWLVRFLLTILVSMVMLGFLGVIANITLFRFDILPMLGQVFFPVTFMAGIGFMLSTVIRNGNGTAITLVIVGFFFFVLYDILEHNVYNIFLNPYDEPRDMSEVIWLSIIFKNRIYLIIGTVLFLLYGLFNLQKRERFI